MSDIRGWECTFSKCDENGDEICNEDGSVNCSVTITSKNNALLSHNYKEDDGLYNKIIFYHL